MFLGEKKKIFLIILRIQIKYIYLILGKRKRKGILLQIQGVLKNIYKLCCFWVVVYSLRCVYFCGTPWTVAHQAPLSMGFSRQEYWSRLSFPSPRELPDLGSSASPALQADSSPLGHRGNFISQVVSTQFGILLCNRL